MSAYSSHDEFLRELRRELESSTEREVSEEYVREAGENLRSLVRDLIEGL